MVEGLQNVPPEPDSVLMEASAPSGIRWKQLRKLGAELFPSTSPFGKPTAFTGSMNYLVVGTYSADVLVFDYEQSPLFQLNARSATTDMLGVVTSLGISDDESHLVAGFGLGAVGLWEINRQHKSGRLLSLVLPSEKGAAHGAGINKYATNNSHRKGVPVVSCGTLRLSGTKTFVSVDASGVVIRHKFKRVMLEHTTRSTRVLGDPAKGRAILGHSLMNNILALQTKDLLLVVKLGVASVDELFSTVLKVPRSRDSAASYQQIRNACVSLCSTGSTSLPLVLYSWNNDLKLVNLDTHSAVAAYKHSASIENTAFLTRNLAVLTSERTVDILSFLGDSPSAGLANSAGDNYLVVSSPCPPIVQLSVLYESIFVLGSYDFQVGQLANWADQLLNLLNSGDPAQAIKLALNFYDHEGDLSIMGLPADIEGRQRVITQALPDLVLTALRFSVQFDQDSLHDLMPQALKAVVLMSPELLESIAELVEGHPASSGLFYGELAKLAHQNRLSRLPPGVFKQLVTINPEPELFYKLDLSTLDIDLAFKLCRVYESALSDVKIYLETQALHDYLAPIKENDNTDVIFRYLTLILTSRVYPTGEDLLPTSEADTAKDQIFNALFLQEHPLYDIFLQKDEKAFFEMLNHAFEDPWLNDNLRINRQVIVSFLLVHVDLNSWYFSSFIAQNNPKYSQFLAISETVLQQVLHTLCSNPVDIDMAQLNILSLLTTYKPRDNAQLISDLTDAHYTMVLRHILGRSRKYLQLAEIELNLKECSLWETLGDSFANDRSATTLFVQTEFEKLIKFDSAMLGIFVARHALANIWDSPSINLEFLRRVFQQIKQSGGVLPPLSVRTNFIRMLANESDSDELISVLSTTLTGRHDVDLPSVVDSLLANNRVDALTILLGRLGRNSEALIYIRNYIREHVHHTGGDLEKYVNLGIYICGEEPDLSIATEMWKQLLETLTTNEMLDQVKNVIQKIAETTSASLPEIIKHLLDDNTTSLNRGVLVSQAYSDLAKKLRIWQCFYEIAQAESLTELLELSSSRKHGWVVSIDGECEVCGHKIVGLGIDAQMVYNEWGHFLKRVPMEGKEGHDRLLFFQCTHSYHYDCLYRMAPKGQCIICYPTS